MQRFHFRVYKAVWKEMDMASYSPLLNENEKESLSYSILCVCEREGEGGIARQLSTETERDRGLCVWLIMIG